jgi:hypothetical protein
MGLLEWLIRTYQTTGRHIQEDFQKLELSLKYLIHLQNINEPNREEYYLLDVTPCGLVEVYLLLR